MRLTTFAVMAFLSSSASADAAPIFLTHEDLVTQRHKWDGQWVQTTAYCTYSATMQYPYQCLPVAYDKLRVIVEFSHIGPVASREYISRNCDENRTISTIECFFIIQFIYDYSSSGLSIDNSSIVLIHAKDFKGVLSQPSKTSETDILSLSSNNVVNCYDPKTYSAPPEKRANCPILTYDELEELQDSGVNKTKILLCSNLAKDQRLVTELPLYVLGCQNDGLWPFSEHKPAGDPNSTAKAAVAPPVPPPKESPSNPPLDEVQLMPSWEPPGVASIRWGIVLSTESKPICDEKGPSVARDWYRTVADSGLKPEWVEAGDEVGINYYKTGVATKVRFFKTKEACTTYVGANMSMTFKTTNADQLKLESQQPSITASRPSPQAPRAGPR